MKTATYPQIGTRAKFVRLNPTTMLPERGEGLIVGFGLNEKQQVMTFIVASLASPDPAMNGAIVEQRVNIDLACLDPSDEYVAKFGEITAQIKATGDEGNGKVTNIVQEYNQRVDALYQSILGAPIEFEKAA